MGARLQRFLLAVGIGFSLLPASVWAGCEEGPLFSSATTQDNLAAPKTFVVGARKKIPGCPGELLKMTAVGVPFPVSIYAPEPGEVYATIEVPPSSAPSTHYVTYTVTDEFNNANTVTLPIRLGLANETPVLSPVSDLVVLNGTTASFTVEVTDKDLNLPLTEDGLRIDGLPGSAQKQLLRLAGGDIVWQVTLAPGSSERGVYRVLIRGKDKRGAMAISEMRLEVR
ncbi:MAG: hypothetical protein HYT90_05705 [Candidatus Omnitrophica bacterium]|nr:hypothetical protein [Candidatus Omnitrophota bacterium]